ncbi:MAG: nucleoside triphosphate pyrophosphohydrolase [Propionibacteriaceae bacterium]|nr:nucleoside triphosphate pyrophosphohydrolase [Propionibacteriaceae bacterium]
MPETDTILTQLRRLHEVMHTLREKCPWDHQQTHETLMTYLIEETAEVVEAVEMGDDENLLEELGDLLLQVFFHAEIASERGAFDLGDIAQAISDKLIARHPYIYQDESIPKDVWGSWEKRKREEKNRASSVDGIPDGLSSLARAYKVVTRIRSHDVGLPLADTPISSQEVGEQLLEIVARAHAHNIDPDQALRQAVRRLEVNVRDVEPQSSDSGAKRP